ncbi:ABC transporter permease [Paenibacillus amylolyticus]|uniref:ABC transporter permease n=1 Tax=Paenibacillus amylolyticus TaxID=1451 RepID=UPI003EBE78AD
MINIKMMFNQIKAHPFTTFVMMLGLIISVVLSTVGIQSIKKSSEYVTYQQQFTLQNKTELEINILNNKGEQEFFQLFKGINNKTGVIISNLSMVTTVGLQKVLPIFWDEDPVQPYPLQEGNYITSQDIEEGQKVALLGKRLQSLSYMKDGQRFVQLDHEEYKVIGILGIEGKNVDSLDGQIMIPATSWSNRLKKMIVENKLVEVKLFNASSNTIADGNKIKLNSRNVSGTSVKVLQHQIDDSGTATIKIDIEVYLAVIIYVLSLINCINITSFWINERRYEIGIKKAFGYTNFDVIFSILFEMCTITFFSVIIGYIVQLVLLGYLEKIIDYPIALSFSSIYFSILFIFISSFVTSIIPIVKAIRTKPAEAMKHT